MNLHAPARLRRAPVGRACALGRRNARWRPLDDAGNTTTLAEYVDILGTIGILASLERYAPSGMRRKRSTPKLAPYNTALTTSFGGDRFEEVRRDTVRWGRLVETAVGAHLLNAVAGTDLQFFYWRDRDREVDYVLADSRRILAVEVKSGHRVRTRSGLDPDSSPSGNGPLPPGV